MTRDEVLARLRAHEAELRAAGVAALYLFGSVARDEAGADSDVDLFFDKAAGHPMTLFDLMALHERVAEVVGCDVDLVDRLGFRPRVRARIEPAAFQVF